MYLPNLNLRIIRYMREFIQSMLHYSHSHSRVWMFAQLLGGYHREKDWYQQGVPPCTLPPDAWQVVVYALRILSASDRQRTTAQRKRRKSTKGQVELVSEVCQTSESCCPVFFVFFCFFLRNRGYQLYRAVHTST
jgi:hypothetical protein